MYKDVIVSRICFDREKIRVNIISFLIFNKYLFNITIGISKTLLKATRSKAQHQHEASQTPKRQLTDQKAQNKNRPRCQNPARKQNSLIKNARNRLKTFRLIKGEYEANYF